MHNYVCKWKTTTTPSITLFWIIHFFSLKCVLCKWYLWKVILKKSYSHYSCSWNPNHEWAWLLVVSFHILTNGLKGHQQWQILHTLPLWINWYKLIYTLNGNENNGISFMPKTNLKIVLGGSQTCYCKINQALNYAYQNKNYKIKIKLIDNWINCID
jgi:hypothetical protein